jgi:hypothetical protein
MARALHVLKGGDVALVRATMERQLAAGDRVSVALLPGASAPELPADVDIHRVPEEWSYERLLEAVFEADHLTTW